MAKKMSAFEKAFSEARGKKQDVFSFGGKSYNTKLASDAPKKVPTPTARPDPKSMERGPRRSAQQAAMAKMPVYKDSGPTTRASTGLKHIETKQTDNRKTAAKPIYGDGKRESYLGKGKLLKG